eukprot:XP_011683128.1 PREDICTED: LOW QUALITY PROTEIN: PHD and RING finger domain-containing protein 1 [Strongylocentrotus purpuratus]
MANHLRTGGPNAIDSLIYDSAAVKFSASLDPLMDLDQKDILARPFISDAKMEANNNFEEEDLKCVAEMGDALTMLEPHLGGGGGGDEDESGEEEVWESVSELASDEEYVTEEEEEEEVGEEGDFEEEDEDDDDDDDEDGEEGVDDEEEEDEEEEDAYIEGENEMDDAAISSEDEGGEKCAICLRSFNDQEVGSPESCDHTFCFECIYEWSKNVTTCPVDRSVFSLILVRNTIHGEIVRQMEVKAQETVDEDQDPTYCEVCGECDREDRLLLCDECDSGYHCECLTPPLIDIPIEEWYCPNCVDHDDESSEDEYMSGLRRPLRRVREYARAIARTQVAERVLSRVRQARELRRIDEEEQTGTTSTATRAPRVPKPRRKTTRKRKTTKRKTTKRKTTKRKTTKRKTTKRKTTKRKTTSTTTTTTGTKKKRRKTRRRKRKVRKGSAGARTAAPSVAKTIRRRIAGKLNLVKPKVGSMMPDMKQKGEQSLLFKRHEIGVASLSLTGGEHLFDPRDDDSHVTRGPGAQSAPTPARPLSATSCPSTSSGPLDLLGSILQAGNILHMKSENITIHKDGTLTSARKKDEKSTPKKSPTKTAHRPSSTSSATSHHHNSEKIGSSRSDPMTPVTFQGQRSSQAEGHPQGQGKSESGSSRPLSSSRVKESQEMGCDDRVEGRSARTEMNMGMMRVMGMWVTMETTIARVETGMMVIRKETAMRIRKEKKEEERSGEEEEEAEEEVEEEEEEDASHAVEQQQEDYAKVGDADERNEDGEEEREEEREEEEVAVEDPMAENVAEEEADCRENVDEVGEEKEENQVEEEQEEKQEVEEQEEELAEGEEQEEEEEVEEEEEQEEEEVVEIENDAGGTLHEQEIEEQNEEEEEDGGEEAGEEQKEDEEEEDGEAEEGEDMDDEQDHQDEVEIVNENAEEEKGGDMTSSKPLIGELECEDISDEDIVPEDGDHAESDDEEGMIKETSDGNVIEAKPKGKDSRKERRSEPGETRQMATEVTESDVKHGASSAEEGEVKTDDESRKGKKTRGKRKRKPKKRNRDKRNVVVDPRKSISLHPLMAPDIPRMPKRGEEPAGRREGSREAYGDLRQVIQVKRDTPYTAEELRRYHEEYWEEYNRRRDERRVERVGGTPWDQYTYDQYAYYEAWRNMGGEFAGGRPWGLHVQRDRSPIYDRRKNGAEPQALLDPRLEAQRESARKESERGKEEGSRKSSEKKTKSESDTGRKEHATKKESTRSQKDEKDKSKKEKTKSKGHVHENSARDKNGREREEGEKDKKYRDKEKGKEKDREKDRESRDKHGHDKEKDRSRQKERERSRERDRSRKDREHRSRDRDRHRSRDRERSRDRGREQSRDRHHKKSGERERSRSRDNDHSRSKHRSRSRDRERSRKRERSSESERVTSRDRRRDRSRDRGRDRSREKVVRTSKDHDKPKERERTRDSVKTIKNEEMKSTSSVPLRKERGKVTVDASGVRKILLGAKATGKPKVPKKVVNKPAPTVVKVERVKVKKIKKEKAGAESKVEKKGKKAKVKGEKKLTKGKKKKAIVKRPLSFDVDEIAAPAKKKKAIAKRPLSFDVDEIAAPAKKKKAPATVVEVKVEDIVLKPPSPLIFDDADDSIPVPSTTRSLSHSPDELFIDIAAPDIDLDLSRTVMVSPKLVLKAKSPADVAVADSSHLETDMYDPFEPTASPPSGIKSPSPIPSEASPAHDNATSSSLEVFKQASTPPPEVPPNPTSTTDVSSSDMATNPSQQGMTNEDRLMLASQASQQITKILNQLATVPVAKPRVSPESPVEQTMSSASIELGLSPEHLSGSSLSVSSLGSDDYKVDLILPQDNIGEPQEDDIEMSAVDLYNKNSRDRYLKKLYHQERVVEEVKLAIKPHYVRKTINKEDYKEILRKSVNQVCHSKTGEINPVKIRRLIDGYVKKAQHKSKKPSGGDPHKSGKAGGGSAGKTSFKTSGKSSSKSAGKSASKATKEPASASKLIEKGRSLGLKSK